MDDQGKFVQVLLVSGEKEEPIDLPTFRFSRFSDDASAVFRVRANHRLESIVISPEDDGVNLEILDSSAQNTSGERVPSDGVILMNSKGSVFYDAGDESKFIRVVVRKASAPPPGERKNVRLFNLSYEFF